MSGDVEIARADEVVFEVGVELEHVAEVFGAGKPKASIGLRSDGIVGAFDAEAFDNFSAICAPVRCSPAMPTVFPVISFPFLKMP